MGLSSRSTSAAIISQTYFDLAELLRHIQDVENLEAARNRRIIAARSPEASDKNSWDRTKSEDGGKSSQQGRRNGDGAHKAADKAQAQQKKDNQHSGGISGSASCIVCYRCRQSGHVAKDCSEKHELP